MGWREGEVEWVSQGAYWVLYRKTSAAAARPPLAPLCPSASVVACINTNAKLT